MSQKNPHRNLPSTLCPHCERYKQSASMWRHKAYELGGTPLPWKPEELLREEYERGFIDGMQHQMQSSVDKAVNAMAQPEQEPVAVIDSTISGNIDWRCVVFPKDGTKLYTTPPHRKPLTDDEIDKLPWEPHEGNPMTFAEGLRYFARAIEAAHGIKE